MKALVGAFNQEKALVGAFSVIVQIHRLTDLRHYLSPSPRLVARVSWSRGSAENGIFFVTKTDLKSYSWMLKFPSVPDEHYRGWKYFSNLIHFWCVRVEIWAEDVLCVGLFEPGLVPREHKLSRNYPLLSFNVGKLDNFINASTPMTHAQ